MKKLIFKAAALLLIIGIFAPAAFVASEINVTIDGVAVDFDGGTGPTIMDGRTLVPVRGVFEALGFDVTWSQATMTAYMFGGQHSVAITIGLDSFTLNGARHHLDVPAQIIDGSTMLPIRALLEALGHEVQWDDAAQTVRIYAAAQWTPADAGRVEIDVAWWGNDARNEAKLAALDIFMDRYPNITIYPSHLAFGDYFNYLAVRIAAGMVPDLAMVNYPWAQNLGTWDVFLDLQTMAHIIDLDNWDDWQLDFMRVGDELVALPHGIDSRVVLYNRRLLEAAGIESFPTNTDDLIILGQWASMFNNPDFDAVYNQYAFANVDNLLFDFLLMTWLYAATGNPMQEGGQMLYSFDEVTAAFDLLGRVQRSGAVQSPQQQQISTTPSQYPVWIEGRAAGIAVWASHVPVFVYGFQPEHPDDLGIAPLPVPPGADPVIMQQPIFGHAISRWSYHPEVAAYLLNFLYTDPEALAVLGYTFGAANLPMVQEVIDATNTGAIDPYFDAPSFRQLRLTIVDDFRDGRISSREAARRFLAEQQAELDLFH